MPFLRWLATAAALSLILPLSACAARTAAPVATPTPRPFPVPQPQVARHVPEPEPQRAAPSVPSPLASSTPALMATPPGLSSATFDLVQTALTMLGTPYRAGGHAPESGFDCSGFVSWVYDQHGMTVPRTVQGLFAMGEPVDARAPAPGDLVFFRTGRRGLGHVGIALGEGLFVHSPATGGVVRIDKMAAAYWTRHYVGARRITEPGWVTTDTADRGHGRH